MKLLFLFFILLLVNPKSYAKRFSSKYCEFELPAGWECALEGAEYVCQSENSERKKESIIILAAKVRGEQDNLDEYMVFLKKPKEYLLPGGKKQISEIKSVKLTRINDHQWVDALQLASEVPGFYTRYLATVKEDLGIAITFSVSKDLYSSYQPVIEKLVSTLRVFRQKTNSDLSSLRSSKSEETEYSQTTFKPSTNIDLQLNRTQKRSEEKSDEDDFLFLVMIVGGIFIFIILKKKKKK
jgi:hypothetical protein